MAECIQCGGRANKRHSCPWCGKQPLCLQCSCECGRWKPNVDEQVSDSERPLNVAEQIVRLVSMEEGITPAQGRQALLEVCSRVLAASQLTTGDLNTFRAFVDELFLLTGEAIERMKISMARKLTKGL